MKQVGLRELKNHLSEYMRLVRAGEHILVTDRGHVVAELGPPPAATARDPSAALAELERKGVLRPPTAKGRALYPRFRRLVPPGTAQRLLDEERGER
jgi:antitoxin (DNA-binding transcriptional repressor) of toxin-antitoxin stability system